MGLEVLRLQLKHLLAQRSGIVEPFLLERLACLVEGLLRLPVQLRPSPARLTDASLGFGVLGVDQVDPGPAVDRSLKVAAVELLLALVEQSLNACGRILGLARCLDLGTEPLAKPRVKLHCGGFGTVVELHRSGATGRCGRFRSGWWRRGARRR